MARILLSNDDGVHAHGLAALAAALVGAGHTVMVAAPDRERSAQGHTLTLHKPLRADVIRPGWWSVSGTPADCVYLALHALLPEPPELVVSGINNGANVGHDVFYSGTVAAAMEAALGGVPSIAVSLEHGPGPRRWDVAAPIAVEVVARALEERIAPGLLLNVNVPNAPTRGLRVVAQGIRQYDNKVEARVDPRGRAYYWLGGDKLGEAPAGETDAALLHQGFATLTPIHADLTHHPSLEAMASWAR
jgi:5'-nucleotidase